MNDLPLSALWRPENTREYKVHFARWNGDNEPLDVMARSLEEWQAWQEWHPGRDDFNRKKIFSLAQMKGAQDYWMFGGVWRVLGLKEKLQAGRPNMSYTVEQTEELACLLGRLKLHRVHRKRGTRLNLENHYDAFRIAEILPDRFSGRPFPGYDSLHLTFSELETLVDNARLDWSTALENINGVYLISDDKSGRRYVGSAYGADGVWSRWCTYVRLGHAGNAGMRDLLREHDLNYCRAGFRFALLEMLDPKTSDIDVIRREAFWKEVLDTRDLHTGLNRN
ncbi:MAG: GIY-YIG nuclease family protein [Pseudomonadota bacterium]